MQPLVCPFFCFFVVFVGAGFDSPASLAYWCTPV